MPRYIGQCDKIRRTAEGEAFWREMISNAKTISEALFLEHADVSDILDDDETWEQYKTGCSDDTSYHCSVVGGFDIVFFKTCGFEFIWAAF